MSLTRGDVVKVLENGVCPHGAHPIVILLISGDMAVLSNITDIENEGFVFCILEPKDDPKIITINSTFRYQSIKEKKVADLELAIAAGKLRYFGKLATPAFSKIIAASQLPDVTIKPKFKAMLKPVTATLTLTAHPSLSAES